MFPQFFIFYLLTQGVVSLHCYNGTFHSKYYGHDPLQFKNIFGPNQNAKAKIRCSLTIHCTDDTMCFVRSWATRGHFAWMVQRGCYQPNKEDAIPKSVTIPTRSMTCRQERYADAEYKVCFCKADWCNSAPKYQVKRFIIYFFIGIVINCKN
ncbi:hypothetical protein evm_013551 [Chilo suppressalis]|nr:hypothetical protein evm_013551 [Chilo suppressalis]